ncbi:DJ-1/PfpI family protein [Vibrio sp. HN007]|jgi:transcriptional regulator GlxA family with amidase domain|uniref:DJ-1/PfpI family protein n=1 Tax=Vibrio iocasae TaxID=3098914 RepID=UPI0035D477D1
MNKYNKLESGRLNVGIFLYPNVTMLDAYGPLQLLALCDEVNVFTFSQLGESLLSDAKVMLLPNYGFKNCPPIDVLIVPGSANPSNAINDADIINRIKEIGGSAKYITSVCTGTLILAEAGLLDGYNATIHWAYREALANYSKVSVVNERVVKDRNRISGGGITSGIDFALELIAEITGSSATAQALELLLEYDPQPPFKTGNSDEVDKKLKEQVQGMVYSIARPLFQSRL